MIVIIIFVRWVSFPAVVVLAGWILIQFLSAPSSLAEDGGVAYFAHIGGFITGLALTPFMRNKGHPLFPSKAEDNRYYMDIEDDTEHFADHDHKAAGHLKVLDRRQMKNAFVERYRKPRNSNRQRPRASNKHLPNVKKSK